MQRASFAQTREVSLPGTIDLGVYPSIRGDEDGAFFGKGALYNGGMGFPTLLRAYQSKAPIFIPGAESCNNCSLKVKAFGFERWNCSLIERTLPEGRPSGDPKEPGGKYLYTTIFDIKILAGKLSDAYHDNSTGGYVNVTVMRKVSHGWDAKLVTQTCMLVPSVVSYNLMVDRGNTTIATTSWKDDVILEPL